MEKKQKSYIKGLGIYKCYLSSIVINLIKSFNILYEHITIDLTQLFI